MVNFPALAQHLITPLVEFPDRVTIDCETTASGRYILVRVAVAEDDREKVAGKNGRTLHMIRVVLAVAAQNNNQAVDINLYGEQTDSAPRKPRRSRPRS